MSDLREAAQQALEALHEETAWFGPTPKGAAAIAALRDALAQEQAEPVEPVPQSGVWMHPRPPVKAQQAEPEPVARECSDPMCACRGGPCAECEEGQREKEIEDLRSSLDFYQRRCEALQSWQSKMRDPERTIVCDILANGFTLDPAFAGNRYTAPPQRKPLTKEEIMRAFYAAEKTPMSIRHGLSVVESARIVERAHGIGEQP